VRKLAFILVFAVFILVLSLPNPARAAGDEDAGIFIKDLKPELKRKISISIDKGVEALKEYQKPDGSWGPHGSTYVLGPTAMALFTLLRCGEEPNSKIINKGFDYAAKCPLTYTYEIALLLMALEARYKPAKRKRGDSFARPPASKRDRALAIRALRALGKGPTWTYQSPGQGDNSNTQYAILGLRAAANFGLTVDSYTWIKIATHFINTQGEAAGPEEEFKIPSLTKDGYLTVIKAAPRGWDYTTHPREGVTTRPTMNMTLAGISNLAICRRQLKRTGRLTDALDKRIVQALYSGYAWVVMYWQRPNRRGYFMYSLERAGVLPRWVYFGKHHWYREGAEFLVYAQEDDGTWQGGYGTIVNVCYMLLFLKLATLDTPPSFAVTPPANNPDERKKIGKSVVGYVRAEGYPATSLAVHVIRLDDRGECVPGETCSSGVKEDGAYAVRGLEKGPHRIIVNSSIDEAFNLNAVYSNDIEIADDHVNRFDLNLKITRFTGDIVLETTSMPISFPASPLGIDPSSGGVILDVSGEQGEFSYYTRMEEDGTFSFGCICAGLKNDRVSAWMPCLEIAAVEGEFDKDEERATLRTEGPVGSLCVETVLSGKSKPVEGVRVTISTRGGIGSRTFITGKKGAGHGGDFSAGVYRCFVSKPGYGTCGEFDGTVKITEGKKTTLVVYLNKVK